MKNNCEFTKNNATCNVPPCAAIVWRTVGDWDMTVATDVGHWENWILVAVGGGAGEETMCGLATWGGVDTAIFMEEIVEKKYNCVFILG